MQSRRGRVDEAQRLVDIHSRLPKVDAAAIAQQTAEKAAAKEALAQRELETAAQLLAVDQLAVRLEQVRLIIQSNHATPRHVRLQTSHSSP